MRKAGSEMPSLRNSQSPPTAAPARIRAAISDARRATRRWIGEKSRHEADRIDHDDKRYGTRDEEIEFHARGVAARRG